ncbi:helix-turn-helix domain-containing protein [Nesterenkonia sphaerica]|uniref:Helix-turn-helix transcriptional regulator n=1 Tax=Nesterenkonia sphaerica TaxID=1804988 RepID=A0A5R9AA67_9MICC|nr:helix-turn-helix transcriptional regulator [Nesterenkonia sphaerica]TLP75508.1 helix-turn-helix transcriptional regulator [Nesterenkonia sphaerica]
MTDDLEAPGTLRHVLSRDQLEEMRFREAVNRLRTDQGLSQGELARRMVSEGWEHFNQATISRIEKGTRPVRLGEARALARVLNTDVGYMISETESSQHLSEFWALRQEALNFKKRVDLAVRGWSDAVARLRYLLTIMDLEKIKFLLTTENQVPFEAAVAQVRRMTKLDIGEFARNAQRMHETKPEFPGDDQEN